MRSAFVFLTVIGLAVGGAAYYSKQLTADTPTEFRTATIEQGDVAATISATGTLEPEEVVDVGAQVAGLITEFGRDPRDLTKQIDYGSVVDADTVLAKIDPRMYKAQVDQMQAQLARSQADLNQLQAKCIQAEKEAKRAATLRPQNAIADTDYDLAVANYEVAKANVDVGKATIKQSAAALQTSKINLAYTTIVSPVKGVIIDRRVNIGQTVVASLSAPSLFLIAKDLSRMQVWASVNEADIGHIHIGMPVQFTVDAFSGEMFEGKVAQIRLNAQMTQNVVTYTVVVSTDNSNGRLLPYLTANLRFQVDQRQDVLLAPNAALRWKPRQAQLIPELRATALGSARHKDGKQSAPTDESARSDQDKKPENSQENSGRLYVKEGQFVRPIDVQVGMTDGMVTEVTGAGVHAGLVVVTGEGATEAATDGDTTNPFLPKLRPRGAKTK